MPPRVVISNLADNILNDPKTSHEGIALIKNKKSIASNINQKRRNKLNCPPIPKG